MASNGEYAVPVPSGELSPGIHWDEVDATCTIYLETVCEDTTADVCIVNGSGGVLIGNMKAAQATVKPATIKRWIIFGHIS